MLANSIKKNSSIPLYQQICDDILNEIKCGNLKENDRIPTEVELSSLYDVSRITVRKAVSELVDGGYLVKQQGMGTFVASKKIERSISIFMGFTEYCKSISKKPNTKLLCAELRDATVKDRQLLSLEEGAKIIAVRRLRLADDIPVWIDEDHFLTKFSFILPCGENQSYYEALRANGYNPKRARTDVDICFTKKDEAALLQVPEGSALILMNGLVVDTDNSPIHTTKMIVNVKRFKLTL